MEEKRRETGIDVIGAVPWGTHLCLFYDTKQDLVDVLVPYFKAGLENNEFCIWVTAEPLGEKEAKEAMGKAVPDFAQYLKRGQIQVLPYTEWYLKDGAFNLQIVLNAWIDELNQALANGYDGMRVTGNLAWLEEWDWRDCTDYEEKVNSVIRKYRMLAICTYPLSKSRAWELIDVMRNHQCALVRQAGDWALLRSRESRETALPATSVGQLTPLQEWFVKSGFEGLDDRGTIELLLSLVLPSQESKRLAKACMEHFKSLRKFLAASPQELQRVGVAPPAIFCIKLLHELPAEILKQKIIEQPAYKSPREIIDYLYYSMRDLKREVFRILYLNSQNQIIDTADLFQGTIDSALVYLRDVFKAAIKQEAVNLIFVHNHPTGDPSPSNRDKQLTRELVFAGSVTQIKVFDHIIIGENRYFSFAEAGLIKKYENDFLNLRIRSTLN